MDTYSMREYIQDFSLDNCKLGNQGYNRVLLQLFGFTGHGKSCFINSCKYVIDDGLYKIYAEPGISNGAETTTRSSYGLTKTITLVDNRGCNKMNKEETGEIYTLSLLVYGLYTCCTSNLTLNAEKQPHWFGIWMSSFLTGLSSLPSGNFLPLDTEVIWQEKGYDASLTKLMNAEREDHSADFIVPLFVYSAKNVIDRVKELKELFDTAKKITGLMPIVVITRELHKNRPDVKEKFRLMGVDTMFSLENYTDQDHLKTCRKHETILKCLYEIIEDVKFRMEVKRDPIGEKIDRRCILLRFIHYREQEKAVEKAVMEAKRQAPEQKKGFFGTIFSWFWIKK